MFKTVLIANRGEIAVRAIRTLKKLGITSVAVYSESDRYAQHVQDADIAIALDGVKPAETYLSIEKLIQAAKDSGAEAIFPGYGFLSESADFSRACEQNQIAFMGPTAEQILEFGLKHRPACPPKLPNAKVERLPKYSGTFKPFRTAKYVRQPDSTCPNFKVCPA